MELDLHNHPQVNSITLMVALKIAIIEIRVSLVQTAPTEDLEIALYLERIEMKESRSIGRKRREERARNLFAMSVVKI